MKLRTLAYAAMIGCALGATSAAAQRDARELNMQQNPATALHAFVEKWQQRILSENLSVADPQNWGVRSMTKLAAFSADRLELANRATSIGELEALMASAPIANGTSLATLMAAKPGNISFASVGAVQKNDPTTTPAAYANLVFTAVNPCRISDSRLSQGGGGPFMNGTSKTIDFGPDSSYSFQGGSATNCGMPTSVGLGQIAAVMFAVSSFSQTGAGYLTFWAATAPDPSATVVSMFYTAGPVQTAFVVAPTDLFSNVFVRGISRGANTEVTTDIVGYFAKPIAALLDCVTTTSGGVSIPANSFLAVSAPACAATHNRMSVDCFPGNFFQVLAGDSGTTCYWNNPTASAVTGTATATCCRTAGR